MTLTGSGPPGSTWCVGRQAGWPSCTTVSLPTVCWRRRHLLGGPRGPPTSHQPALVAGLRRLGVPAAVAEPGPAPDPRRTRRCPCFPGACGRRGRGGGQEAGGQRAALRAPDAAPARLHTDGRLAGAGALLGHPPAGPAAPGSTRCGSCWPRHRIGGTGRSRGRRLRRRVRHPSCSRRAESTRSRPGRPARGGLRRKALDLAPLRHGTKAGIAGHAAPTSTCSQRRRMDAAASHNFHYAPHTAARSALPSARSSAQRPAAATRPGAAAAVVVGMRSDFGGFNPITSSAGVRHGADQLRAVHAARTVRREPRGPAVPGRIVGAPG
jgi:hypothetical protein